MSVRGRSLPRDAVWWKNLPMQNDHGADEHTHVRVVAGIASNGKPVYEVLPSRRLEHDDYEICGSPGLAYGFAAGDHVRVMDDGTFEVLARGGNLCLRLYPTVRPSDSSVAALRSAVEHFDGLVEMPADRRFIVITVPVAAGLHAAGKAADGWAVEHGCPWEYGNVYRDGRPRT